MKHRKKRHTSVEPLQATIDRIRSNSAPLCELRQLLSHGSPLIRGLALKSLAVSGRHDEGLVDELTAAALDPVNDAPWIGTISVAHVAVECLSKVGTLRAVEAAHALLKRWPESDRVHLTLYLNASGWNIQ